MRTESLIAPGIFVVVWVIAMALLLAGRHEVDSRIHVVDGDTVRFKRASA